MRSIYAALPLLFLAGCSSVPAENPAEIPSDRVMAFQEPVQGGGTLYVHRDFGKIGGGCHVVLSVDRKPAARIRVGEMVSFQLRPGQHVVGIGIDEQDGGMCSMGRLLREELATVKAGETVRYRIVSEASSGFDIKPDDDR